jgi:hypothetical protein
MGIESELSQAFIGLFKSNSIMSGGGVNNKVGTFFYLLLFFLIILLLRSFVVKIAYNHVMPTLMYSVNKGEKSYEETIKNFNEISYVEALLLVILCSMLFSRS